MWSRQLVDKQIGKYKLVEFVGSGKIGYVYRAVHVNWPDLERAVKLVFQDQIRDGWENELYKVLKLDIVDNVVHLHEFGFDYISHMGVSHQAQYTMWDFISPGRNLKQYLVKASTIPTSFAIAVVSRILHVLHACEARGVSRHGDLHSGNILIGDTTPVKLDDMLEPRDPIYVSDFGYGTTGAQMVPKDDYRGLGSIINEMLQHVDRSKASATDRRLLESVLDLGKFLSEGSGPERRAPKELLQILNRTRLSVQPAAESTLGSGTLRNSTPPVNTPSVGQFQVTEMIGDRWDWWKTLFVPTVPAGSKILSLDIPTVVTGPRGCGKTMLFRRLSERLIIECGEVAELLTHARFVAFYVNANDFSDAFAHFPDNPSNEEEGRLICYANLCILADLLAVQSASSKQLNHEEADELLKWVHNLLISDIQNEGALLEGEDRLERYRSVLEEIKWKFLGRNVSNVMPGYAELSTHRWLPHFFQKARTLCTWIGQRSVIVFVDDYSTPRVSASMQRVLNRLLLQRSPYFLAKLATEAATTFHAEDSSGKNLEDGDDYQFVDMGEEALFLPERERLAFLNEVLARRLESDHRIPRGDYSLKTVLGHTGISKTEFARRLRGDGDLSLTPLSGHSQQRGRSRRRALYYGADVFSNLWSGDTRTMIQLIADVVDQASSASPGGLITTPIPADLQDRVFRTGGGEWLNSHTRNAPTNPAHVERFLAVMRERDPEYRLSGEYGDHLKAVVEAFVEAARLVLLGPTYPMKEGNVIREVPHMAFRIEIMDDFRIDGLAREIYRDLIRYGLFIRDNRGKSVRGTFVPRLYLRRLLLPVGALALSKRDSVRLTCNDFIDLLLRPDEFRSRLDKEHGTHGNQMSLFVTDKTQSEPNAIYDDVSEAEPEPGTAHADAQLRDKLEDPN